MARYGQRPENALKRANEFIDVGKPARALDTLSEVFRNKKWAYTWSESVLEPIMFKYLDLCVELKKSVVAKEGLFQYRNMFQSVNVGSLENVIRFYLKTAEDRTEAARNQSQQAVFDIEIDDLDNLATPESILLSAVSGEDAQDRSDRTILTPWVKFLWESYCQCLELLRTNVHVETLYHDIARMAFQFCLKYNRKTEFRKLCDKLRKHLEDIGKLAPQVANVSITKPETQQLNLETRLYQLEYAIQMELWQEAYKAIEDIHNLMNLSKKSPMPKTMANYYQKLALVFWKAGNYLFHAAALFKLFQLSKEMKKNMSPEELQRMACRVLLATLSIPLPSAHPEFDRFIETDRSPLEKAQRLAVLLGLPQPPTRASLLKDLLRVNVVNLASKQLQDLYSWLEVEFHPLLLCERVQTVIEVLQNEESSSLQQYIPALQDVTLVRLIRQVAQVYQTIELSRMMELAKFTDAFHLERLLVDCVRHNDMQIRIDHGAKCIRFGIDLSEAQREDKPEGPTLQCMPSEQVRNQLVNMAAVLHKALNTIYPNKKKLEREKLRAKMVQQYHESKLLEHERILKRHKIIEDRKEYIERKNTQREEEEMRRQEHIQRQLLLQEQKRIEAEREQRERRRIENEVQQIRDRYLKEKMQQISQTAHGQKILKKLDEDDMKKLDAEQIAAKEAEEIQKEKREMQQRLKTQEKRVDYFERAKRLEEIPLLEKAFEEKQVQDKLLWEQREGERIEKLIEDRELAVKCAERLKRMTEDKNAFVEKLKSERRSIYLEKLEEFEKRLDEERKKRLAERRQRRKEERRQQYLREKEEEAERKRAEEERRKQKEEEERQEKLRKQREDEFRKEKEKKDHQAEIQRMREEEAERRRMDDDKKLREKEYDAWRGDKGDSRYRDGKRDWNRDRDIDRDRDKSRDEGNDEGDWRRGGGPLKDEPKKTEAWRPSGVWSREREKERDREKESRAAEPVESWRSSGRAEPSDRFERDKDRDMGRERDRDMGRDRDRFMGRDRDRDMGRDRDRDMGRDRDRDMGRDRDRDMGRDRDRDMGRDRDRDMGRDRDRDMGRDRDRDMGRDRDRDMGRDRDRDMGRDRDREGPSRGYDRLSRGGRSDRDMRDNRESTASSWRSKDGPDRGPMRREDDRPRRDDRDKDDRMMRRGPRDDDRGPRGQRDDRGHDDWRSGPSRDEPRGTPSRSKDGPREDSRRGGPRDPPPKEDKPKGRQEPDDDEWKTVGGRR